MPYVSESLIVLQNDKLVALIYPDFDDAFAHGMEQSEDVYKRQRPKKSLSSMK